MKRIGYVIAGAVLLAACGGGGDGTFTASGMLGLVAVDAGTADCSSGKGGFDDIRGGVSVVIYDADNKKVALGSLKTGKDRGEGLCVFDFKVDGIPKGNGPYGVEVGSRGQVSFDEKDADEITISLG